MKPEAAGEDSAASCSDVGFDPVAYINTPRWQKVSLGLERTRLLLELLGRPQDDVRFVHVAGTNGKGSVSSYLASVLQKAGYTCGLFTSPYIETFEERIRVNGENIPADHLREVTLCVRDAAAEVERRLGEHPTEFELMTAVALLYFSIRKCDIVVLEVGLGGRLDSTNVIEAPEVCIITRIGIDHTAVLGDTLEAIAGEKAGIIKPGVPVVSWPQETAAMAVVRAIAEANGCELILPDFAELTVGDVYAATVADADDPGVLLPIGPQGPQVMMRGFVYADTGYRTRLLGAYQPANATLAIEAVRVLRSRGWDISEGALIQGIAETRWPGRFEIIDADPLTVVDGGHNLQGAQALVDSLADLARALDLPPRCAHFAMGVLADKDYRGMIGTVVPYARSFTVFAPDNPRALPADVLAATIRGICDERGLADVQVEEAASPFEALTMARLNASFADEIALGFGSLYSIAAMKHA